MRLQPYCVHLGLYKPLMNGGLHGKNRVWSYIILGFVVIQQTR